MTYLNTADYAVIGVYFLVLVGLGFYLSRKAAASLEDYFLGGRKLPWWVLGVSGMASNLDITGTMLIVSFLYLLGPRGLFIEFRGGAVLILAVMLLFTGKWNRRSGCMTAAEWMVYRFGEGAGGHFARIVTALSVVIGIVGGLAYMIKGVGLFLATFLPYSPAVCALIMMGVATLYTMVSGFYGVVYTDLFQSVIILSAVIGISLMASNALSGYDGTLADLAEEVTGSQQWTSCVPEWETTMPPGKEYEPYRYLVMFAFFYLLKNVALGMMMGGDPKYYGARNERECGTLSFVWTCLLMFRWPMMMGFAVLGLFLVRDVFPDQSVLVESASLIQHHLGPVTPEQWPEVLAGVINSPAEQPGELIAGLQSTLGDGWSDKLHLVSHDGAINPERILPAVVRHRIPMGFRGMMLVALLAASMSTFDSNVNGSAAYFTRDIYQRYLRPGARNRELMIATYVYIVLIVAGGFAMAASATSINNIWTWLMMGLGAGLLVPGLLKYYWWRFNATGVVVGMLFGLVGSVADWKWPGIGSAIARYFPGNFPRELVGFIYLVVVGLIGSIMGTYLGKPCDARVLEYFYRTTRPFGIWGPLKRTLTPHTQAIMTREHRNDILALPFTLGWQITLFLLPMLLVIRNYRGFFGVLVIFLICLGGMYVFWYRNLPPATAGVLNNPDDYP